MAKLYRLLAGSIGRPNPETGEQESHKAPYDFVPLKHEYDGNAFRLRFIQDIPDDDPRVPKTDRKITATGTAPATIPANTQEPYKPGDDIRKANVKEAQEYIATVDAPALLDLIFEQESANTPQVRRTVLAAVQARRNQLLAQAKQTPAAPTA